MVINKSLFGVCILVVAALASCSDGADLQKPRVGRRPILNIEDASSLVVLEGSSSGGRLASGGRVGEVGSFDLYKLTTSGSLEVVVFLNEDGIPIDPSKDQASIKVNDVFDVTRDYLVLQGQFSAWDSLGNSQFYLALLVNKTNGHIYDFHDADMVGGPFFEDGQGNFYYRNANSQVIQVDVSDPDFIRKAEYLPSGQTAESLAGVDLKGNAFYVYNNSNDQLRIRKKNGGVFEFELSEERYLNGMWMGLNGKMYLETSEQGSAGWRAKFHAVNVDDDGLVSIDTVWSGVWKPYNGGSDYILGSGSHQMLRVNKEKSILFVSVTHAWEFFEESNTLTEVSLPKVEQFDDFFYSQDHLYYRAGSTIYKVSLSTYGHEILSLPAGDKWEIYSMSLGDNETVQVSALRFSDGKKIFGQIDPAGVFSILDEEVDREAIVLQRLN